MAFREELNKAYKINPDYLGSHFATKAPESDIFGRRQVSPAEIQRRLDEAKEANQIRLQNEKKVFTGKKRRWR